MSMNVSSLSGSYGSSLYIDSEYKRIIEELRALGIEPSGNKSSDKMKLQEVKQQKQNLKVEPKQFVSEVKESEKSQTISSEDTLKNSSEIQAQEMLGASQIADYNKYKLLGIY